MRGAAEAQHVKKRRHPVRGEPLSRPGWPRRPSSSRWVSAALQGVAGPGCEQRGGRAEERAFAAAGAALGKEGEKGKGWGGGSRVGAGGA